jgi:protein-S-isoprenylcysteine O-methyltransferase Ste14
MGFLEAKIPPPLVVLLLAGVMKAATALVPVLQPPGAARTGAAVLLAAVGLAVELAGGASLIRSKTTVDPTHPHGVCRFVSTGVYRLTRNPIYLGDLLLLLAWATYLWSPVAVALTPLFVIYIDRFQIKAEERALEEIFGAKYVEYKNRVRRWV